jgi:hypothetical protein
MKKILFLVVCLIVSYSTLAQKHGIKAGVSFTRIAGDIPDGSEISSLVCPSIAYTFRTMGDRWGYFLEIGYSQSGFKENFEGSESKVKFQNIDLVPAGLQFAFLSDWAKVRPVIQTSVIARLSFNYKITTPSVSDDGFLDQPWDIIWTIGAGAMITKHATVIVNYGFGFLNVNDASINLKSRQLQISANYIF